VSQAGFASYNCRIVNLKQATKARKRPETIKKGRRVRHDAGEKDETVSSLYIGTTCPKSPHFLGKTSEQAPCDLPRQTPLKRLICLGPPEGDAI
jgi:hypothetical protein